MNTVSTDSKLLEKLQWGAEALSLELSDTQLQLLMQYLSLMIKWNRAYNLSAIRDPADMVALHLLDSISVSPYLQDHRFVDVGSGGGLPGIPLAILNPDCHFTLLDSNGKKTRFLHQVRSELSLENVEVVNLRAENFHPEPQFDAIICRAFASLPDILAYSRHLGQSGARIYAMKGLVPEEELNVLARDFTVVQVQPISVPGVEAQRHLIVLSI